MLQKVTTLLLATSQCGQTVWSNRIGFMGIKVKKRSISVPDQASVNLPILLPGQSRLHSCRTEKIVRPVKRTENLNHLFVLADLGTSCPGGHLISHVIRYSVHQRCRKSKNVVCNQVGSMRNQANTAAMQNIKNNKSTMSLPM